jgi:hypothetical protein
VCHCPKHSPLSCCLLHMSCSDTRWCLMSTRQCRARCLRGAAGQTAAQTGTGRDHLLLLLLLRVLLRVLTVLLLVALLLPVAVSAPEPEAVQQHTSVWNLCTCDCTSGSGGGEHLLVPWLVNAQKDCEGRTPIIAVAVQYFCRDTLLGVLACTWPACNVWVECRPIESVSHAYCR